MSPRCRDGTSAATLPAAQLLAEEEAAAGVIVVPPAIPRPASDISLLSSLSHRRVHVRFSPEPRLPSHPLPPLSSACHFHPSSSASHCHPDTAPTRQPLPRALFHVPLCPPLLSSRTEEESSPGRSTQPELAGPRVPAGSFTGLSTPSGSSS